MSSPGDTKSQKTRRYSNVNILYRYQNTLNLMEITYCRNRVFIYDLCVETFIWEVKAQRRKPLMIIRLPKSLDNEQK